MGTDQSSPLTEAMAKLSVAMQAVGASITQTMTKLVADMSPLIKQIEDHRPMIDLWPVTRPDMCESFRAVKVVVISDSLQQYEVTTLGELNQRYVTGPASVRLEITIDDVQMNRAFASTPYDGNHIAVIVTWADRVVFTEGWIVSIQRSNHRFESLVVIEATIQPTITDITQGAHS